MVRKLNVVDEEESRVENIEPVIVTSHKQHLLNLYKELKDLGVRSISDLENLIARAE